MKFFKKTVIVLGVLLLTGVALSEQGIGMQADLISQGIAYRLLSRNGVGFEIAGRAILYPEQGDFNYNISSELRVLKLFNPGRRIRFYLGGGLGYWNRKEYERQSIWVDEQRYEVDEWVTQQGISIAVLLGLDIMVFKFDETHGLSVSPEIQFGYYTLPGDLSYYEGEWKPEPERWVLPGAGIGFRYVW
jgi:hypothetical protein